MNASSLLVPSPFGRAFLRAPPWLQETLRHHGFGPHQSDGHVLVHTCLRPAVPEDELVLEDHPDFVDVGSRVTWTTTFGYILNTALTRMWGGDPASGDHMEVHLQMLELLAKVRGGPDPTAYTERQLRWEIVDRERWLNSFIPAPITDLKLVKWRHWKPSRIKELGPINQKVLEGHLRRKWAERLLAHLIPHAGEISHLAPLRGDNEEQEFHDLLADTRFRTLRQRCLVLEQMLKWDLPIPWKESNVRELLNRLRAQEVTPHKLQLCWDTLRWFAKKFGLLAVQEEHRLLQKKQTAVVQPARKAKVPPKEVIWALEEGAAGVPLLPGAHSPQEKGAYAPRELDTFILGIVRYQVGCSARFNDLQHTAPSTLKHTTTTLEFSAWQTKTVSAARIRKHPVPLICPKYSFTGHAWWQPLLTWWTRLSKHPSFEESDYLIPTISKDGMGFIARPADRTLRWLKDALGRRGVPPELFQDLTWHSFRVFIPDCAFQLGISRDQRRYLGNWMTESTADVYTREKRNVVVKVWHEVANNLSEISMGGRMVSVTLTGRACPWLSHPHQRRAWRTPSSASLWRKTSQSFLRLRINHHLFWRKTTQVRSKKCLLYRKNRKVLYPARHQRTNWALLTALSGWWHLQGNQAQWPPTRSTCWRWTTRQWDVDGSPLHWKHKISIPLTISPIQIVTRSVWDVSSFMIFLRTGLWNRQPKKKTRRSHHLRRIVSLMTQ